MDTYLLPYVMLPELYIFSSLSNTEKTVVDSSFVWSKFTRTGVYFHH